MSSHAEFRDMIAPYALGALEQPESSAVEEHLAECAFCSNLAREASEVGHYLSYSAAYRVPPTGGLDRLLESIGRQPLPVPQHDARADQRRRPRWPAWLSAPVALPVAAVPLLALSMAGWNMLLMGDLKADHEEMGALHDRLAQQSHLLVMVTSGSAVTRPLAGTALAPSAEVRLIMDSDTNSAMLMASRLPPLPAGEIYQVWWGRQGAR
ncbi:MAG: anti-sigma factor, partial [Chloroflexi bacterium]|nr:anti-sigma factor [Chloroflexota bacterium]